MCFQKLFGTSTSLSIFVDQTVGFFMIQDTKVHILEVSLLLFLQKSYKAVTLSEIVKATGMSKGAFYHYFDSKQSLFEEVVKFYFEDELNNDFSNYNQTSLKDFYDDYLTHVVKELNFFEKINSAKVEDAQLNQYFLLFDAIFQFPSFRKQINEHNEKELSVWERVIAHAKKTGEIKSAVTDENIARMYMYMGDGNLIHSIFKHRKKAEVKKTIKELKALWDELYELLKNKKE